MIDFSVCKFVKDYCTKELRSLIILSIDKFDREVFLLIIECCSGLWSCHVVDDLGLPSGLRFTPSDEQLVQDYLSRWVHGRLVSSPLVARDNVYKAEPWVLLNGREEAYFFTEKRPLRPGSKRAKRSAGAGSWVLYSQEEITSVVAGDRTETVGIKSSLSYSYQGNKNSGWTMHEFQLPSDQFENRVLCRIKVSMMMAKGKSKKKIVPKITSSASSSSPSRRQQQQALSQKLSAAVPSSVAASHGSNAVGNVTAGRKSKSVAAPDPSNATAFDVYGQQRAVPQQPVFSVPEPPSHWDATAVFNANSGINGTEAYNDWSSWENTTTYDHYQQQQHTSAENNYEQYQQQQQLEMVSSPLNQFTFYHCEDVAPDYSYYHTSIGDIDAGISSTQIITPAPIFSSDTVTFDCRNDLEDGCNCNQDRPVFCPDSSPSVVLQQNLSFAFERDVPPSDGSIENCHQLQEMQMMCAEHDAVESNVVIIGSNKEEQQMIEGDSAENDELMKQKQEIFSETPCLNITYKDMDLVSYEMLILQEEEI